MNCPICNREMWNNIGRKTNPKQPDYKCKDKNCKGVIWPPKQPGQQAPSPAPKNGNEKEKEPDSKFRSMALSYTLEYLVATKIIPLTDCKKWAIGFADYIKNGEAKKALEKPFEKPVEQVAKDMDKPFESPAEGDSDIPF